MFQRVRAGRSGRSVIAFRFAVLATLVGATVLPRSAFAAVPFNQATFSASATGTAVHADALQSGTTRLEDAEEAFSSALVDSESLNGQDTNELDRVIQPTSTADPVVNVSNKNSYGMGSGLEVGLGLDPQSAANQALIAGVAEAAAPPSTDVVRKEVGPVPASPIAYASLLRGQAQANWNTGGDCILGADFSTGYGFAADAQLISTGEDNEDGSMQMPLVAADAATPGERAVSNSLSHTLLVRQFGSDGKTLLGKDWGLMAEVRQTIAPITLFKGTENELTIELLGEWVLQAVATGLPNKGTVKGGFVHYGPGDASPSTPIARIIQAGEVSDIIRFQDILGDEGLVIPIPGLAEIAIGEDPRAIGGNADTKPTETPTSVSGAVDVVRVRLIPSDTSGDRVVDLRAGHMEVKSRVPAGGISCQLPVIKDANPDSVNVGQEFTSTIRIENPFNCKLINVKVVDEITTTGGARFTVVSTDPKANSVPTGTSLDEGTITWNNIGSIDAGKSKTVSAVFRALGGAGKIIDVATATGTLAECQGEGADVAGVGSGVEGAGVQGVSRPFEVPVGGVKALAPTGVGGPATTAGLSLLGAAAVTAVLVRRRRIVS